MKLFGLWESSRSQRSSPSPETRWTFSAHSERASPSPPPIRRLATSATVDGHRFVEQDRDARLPGRGDDGVGIVEVIVVSEHQVVTEGCVHGRRDP